MDALLTTAEAELLAEARTLCAELDKRLGRAALEAQYEADANPDARDLARIAAKADSTERAITDLLITAKVYGEMTEAGDVL